MTCTVPGRVDASGGIRAWLRARVGDRHKLESEMTHCEEDAYTTIQDMHPMNLKFGRYRGYSPHWISGGNNTVPPDWVFLKAWFFALGTNMHQQVFQVTFSKPFRSGVSGDRLHAFQVFQVTVQVSNGTFSNDFESFQASGESGLYNTFKSPEGLAFADHCADWKRHWQSFSPQLFLTRCSKRVETKCKHVWPERRERERERESAGHCGGMVFFNAINRCSHNNW